MNLPLKYYGNKFIFLIVTNIYILRSHISNVVFLQSFLGLMFGFMHGEDTF